MNDILPGPGLLPIWLLIVTAASLFNTVQCFISPTLSQRVYSAQPAQVSPLSARTSGIWTLLAAIIRFKAAYDIHNKTLYDLTAWTFRLAWIHFASEWLLFRTANMGKGLISPVLVATGSIVWIWMQRDAYVTI